MPVPKRVKSEIASGIPKTTAGLVAASFALPDEFTPLRMRDEYSTEETALFKVNEEHKPNWATSTGAGNEQLPLSTHVEFLFNDLLRNRIVYERNDTGIQWNYGWRFGRTPNNNDQTTMAYFKGATTDMNELSHAVSNVSTFQPHMDMFFALGDKDRKGMWVDATSGATSTVSVVLSVAPTATGGSLVLWRWANGQWVEFASQVVTIAVTTYNFTLTQSGYHNVQMCAAVDNNFISISSIGTCGCWGHKYAPYAVLNAGSIESCRILGQSILVRNISADLYKQGNICGIQPGKNRVWTSFAGYSTATDPYPVVEDYAGSDGSQPLAKGIYGFKKATEPADFRLKIPFTIENVVGSTSTTWTDADASIVGDEYLVVAMQCGTQQGRDIIVRTVTAGEIETGNQWLNVMKPMAQPNEWRDGMECLASFKQWYCNPIHWGAILRTIGSVATVGGRLLSLFPDARAQAAGYAASAVGNALQ